MDSGMLQEFSAWISLLQIPVWGIIGWGWWSLKKIFVRQSDCSACREVIEERHKGMERQQEEFRRRQEENRASRQALEERLKGVPTVHDLHRLEILITNMSGDVKRVGSEVEGLCKVQNHMRSQFDDLLQLHLKPGA